MINQDIVYKTPREIIFFEDCFKHSVRFRIDMIEDTSWRRFLSDKPIQWMFDNFNQSREAIFVQKNHVMASENELWREKMAHVEAGFTIRTNNTDYILQIEINSEFLDYFVKKYDLKPL